MIKATLTRQKTIIMAGVDNNAPDRTAYPGKVLTEVRYSRLEAMRLKGEKRAVLSVYGQSMPATLAALVKEIGEEDHDPLALEQALMQDKGWSALFRNGQLLHSDEETPYAIFGFEKLQRAQALQSGDVTTERGGLCPGWRHVRLDHDSQTAMVMQFEEDEVRCSLLERGLGREGKMSLMMPNKDHMVRLRDVLTLAGTIIEGHNLAARLGMVDDHGRPVKRYPSIADQGKPETLRFLDLRGQLTTFLQQHKVNFWPDLQPYWG